MRRFCQASLAARFLIRCEYSASIPFDYDYDNNEQRGAGTSGSDVPFTGVALGLGTAQYVVTTGTWTRSTANSVNFVAALERNYSNPA